MQNAVTSDKQNMQTVREKKIKAQEQWKRQNKGNGPLLLATTGVIGFMKQHA